MGEHERTQAPRVKSWDGIRALSALAVFAYHATIPGFTGGWLGVEVFFVLSGYLITGLLLREHDRTGRIALDRFWTRRLLRLWPALVVMVVVVAPLYRIGLASFASFHAYLLAAVQVVLYLWDVSFNYIGGTAGFLGHTWTLGMEMYFYLAWPLLLIWLLGHGRRLVIPCLIALCCASIAGALIHAATAPNSNLGYYAPYTQALPLLVGCLLAAIRQAGLFPSGRPALGAILAALGACGLVIAVVSAGPVHTTSFLVPLLATTVCSSLLLAGLEIAPNSALAAMLSWRPLATLGLWSYSFYLYQSPIIFTLGFQLGYVIHPLGLRMALMLPLTVLVSAASYTLIERRFLRLKRRFEPRALAVAAH